MEYKKTAQDDFWKSQLAGKTSEQLEDMTAQAVYDGKIWHVGQLLDMGISINMEGELEGRIKQSLLHTAVDRKNHQMAEFLLKRGAEPEVLDECCQLPLVMAVMNNDIEMVRLLMNYGANPLNDADEYGSAIKNAKKKPEILDLLEQYSKFRRKPANEGPDDKDLPWTKL